MDFFNGTMYKWKFDLDAARNHNAIVTPIERLGAIRVR
jgi:hypothetical protein